MPVARKQEKKIKVVDSLDGLKETLNGEEEEEEEEGMRRMGWGGSRRRRRLGVA